MEQYCTMEKDFQEDALNSMALSEDKAKIHGFSETEKKESFFGKLFSNYSAFSTSSSLS